MTKLSEYEKLELRMQQKMSARENNNATMKTIFIVGLFIILGLGWCFWKLI